MPEVIITRTNLNYLYEEVQNLLDEFDDIVVDDFPSE